MKPRLVGRLKKIRTVFLVIIFLTIVVATAYLVSPFKNLIHNQVDLITGLCVHYETCDRHTVCGHGNDSLSGCPTGATTYIWKDPILKSAYYQISKSQAKQCAEKFIEENRERFQLYSPEDLNTQLIVSGTEKLDASKSYFTKYIVGPIDPSDIYYWNVGNSGVDLVVGAQTCKVYPPVGKYQ